MRGRGQICFGVCQFDPLRGELRRQGKAVALTPQAVGLLTYLVDHRDRAVPRRELLDQLWDGVVVSDGALSTAIYELRAALGDDGRQQQVIHTLRGRGFRFVAPVELVGLAAPAVAIASTGFGRHRQLDEDIIGTDASTAASALPATGTPFVGRQTLLAGLHRALADAGRGQARVVVIEGEAGIGKTSLAQHFAAAVGAVQVLWGRCYEHAGAPPFWPWTQVLRALVAAADPAELRRLLGVRAATLVGALVPELREVFPRPRGQTANAAEARFQLFDGVAALLRAASARTPLLLVVDDIHCADHPSLLLLEFLAAELARARVMLVATYRGEEVGEGHALATTLAALARAAPYERHVLRGLEHAEVRDLLATVAVAPMSAVTVESIVRRSEGNPLFVTELVRQMDGRGGDNGAAADTTLPQPVQAIIHRRIARLAPLTQEALGVAAVLGRDIRFDVLARTWDGPVPLPAAWLDEAIRAHVVTPSGRGRARFTHALFQEAFYGRLDATRRSALHRRAGEATEAVVVAPAGAELAALAHHFTEALQGGGDAAKAVDYSRAAARAACELLAYEEAVQHYQRALHALEWRGEFDSTSYVDALLGLGEAQHQAGDAKSARDTFLRAASRAHNAGWSVFLARAALGYAAARDQVIRIDGYAAEESMRMRGAALLADAFAGLGDEDPALRVRVGAALAVAAVQRSADERERLSRAAVDDAERLGDPILLLEVVAARRELLWSPDNVEERLQMATTIVALAQRSGDREHELCGRAWRLTDLLELGEIGQVRDEMETCDRLAEEIGQLRYRHHVAVLRATLAILDGCFADAERLTYAARAIGRRMRSEAADMFCLVHLVTLRREQGGLEALEAMVRDAVARYPVHALRCMLAYMLGEMEHLAEARAQYELLAREDFADVPRDRSFLATLSLLTQLCVRLDDRRRAAALYELILPFADRNVIAAEGVCSLGAAAHQLGILATMLERWDDADRHFRAALALDLRHGVRAYLGQIQLFYAIMFLARQAPGDHARALALLDDARATAEHFGSHGLRRRILGVRDRALMQHPPAPLPIFRTA